MMTAPSTLELMVVVILFFVAVAIQGYEIHRRNKVKKLRSTEKLASETRFQPGIYWFRDYWSNRNRLGRNKEKSEGMGWKTNEEFEIDLLGPGELNLSRDEKDYVTIKDPNGDALFTEIVDPKKLIKEIEPRNTEVIGIVPSLPIGGLDTTGAMAAKRKEDAIEKRLSRYTRNQSPPPPEVVYTEPMTQLKGKPNFTLFFISILVVWGSSIVLRYVISIFSFLEALYLPLLAFSVGSYVFILAWYLLSETTKKLKEASAFIQLYDGKNPTKFHYDLKKDVPRWLDSKLYWVFSYVYNWKGELTAKSSFPFIYFKKDMERIEVWADAKTGKMEWIVTDYHYRELWYQVDSAQTKINLLVLPNFHTLVPLNITFEEEQTKDLFDYRTPLFEKWESYKEKRQNAHNQTWINSEIGSGFVSQGIVSERLAILWWDYWRYPLGADNEIYNHSQEPSTFFQPIISEFVQPINSKAEMDALVLPDQEKQKLKEIAGISGRRSKVDASGEFKIDLSRGPGVTVLFEGYAGSGKTVAAEVLANELRLPLYRVDLSAVVSKYIGETEKNLMEVFDAAEKCGGILFFDDADALFGKRTGVKDSRDRFANINVNCLLEKMENYGGLAILATNSKSDIDAAFLRRVKFIVNFPFPKDKS